MINNKIFLTAAADSLLHSFPLLISGILIIISLFWGKIVGKIKLPSIIGFMIAGIIAGPSVSNLIDNHIIDNMGFINEITLGFVAISIGLELSIHNLKNLGAGILFIIVGEVLATFLITGVCIYLFSGDMPLSLVLAAIATASAPAGTVAVIKEYKARGPLTQALYAVVGFDDGLGIIIFGFAVAAAKLLLSSAASAGTNKVNFLQAMVSPFKEVLLSIILGVMIAYVMSWFLRFFTARSSQNIFILIFGTILIATGLSNMMHLSLILTNMVIGIIIVNTQPNNNVETIKNEAASLIPLLFVFFFSLAGASLHIGLLPSLGMLSIVYIAARSAGKISGSWIGAVVGKCSDKLKKFIGIGILSQAGLAIGLALIIKHEFNGLGPVISKSGLPIQTWGDQISGITIATVTATCIIFEILGPVLARYALLKAGEIKD